MIMIRTTGILIPTAIRTELEFSVRRPVEVEFGKVGEEVGNELEFANGI